MNLTKPTYLLILETYYATKKTIPDPFSSLGYGRVYQSAGDAAA